MNKEQRIKNLCQSIQQLEEFQGIKRLPESIRDSAVKTIEWHERGSNPSEVKR